MGAVIIAIDEWLKSRGAKFRVPVLAAAIGIYLPLELMVPIFLGGLLSHLVPVSYTHLDVYKRQGLSGAHSLRLK